MVNLTWVFTGGEKIHDGSEFHANRPFTERSRHNSRYPRTPGDAKARADGQGFGSPVVRRSDKGAELASRLGRAGRAGTLRGARASAPGAHGHRAVGPRGGASGSVEVREPSGSIRCPRCKARIHYKDRRRCHKCRGRCCPACLAHHGCNCPQCTRQVGRAALHKCEKCGFLICWNCYRDHLCIRGGECYQPALHDPRGGSLTIPETGRASIRTGSCLERDRSFFRGPRGWLRIVASARAVRSRPQFFCPSLGEPNGY